MTIAALPAAQRRSSSPPAARRSRTAIAAHYNSAKVLFAGGSGCGATGAARPSYARLGRSRAAQPAFGSYQALFDALRGAFDVGVINLNYDGAALTAMPGAFTGFNSSGEFDPAGVHERTAWDFVYHLHG